MNQVIQTVLAAFSNQNIEINTARKLANLKKLDPLHLWVEKEDIVIKTECGKIPLRLYFPSEETKRQKEEISSAIFFIHGGGWSTESVETYFCYGRQLRRKSGGGVVSAGKRPRGIFNS